MYAGTGYKAEIDQNKCTKCGQCVTNCNFVAISAQSDDSYAVDKSLCMGCEACATKCTAKAITLKLEDAEKLAPMNLKKLIKK